MEATIEETILAAEAWEKYVAPIDRGRACQPLGPLAQAISMQGVDNVVLAIERFGKTEDALGHARKFRRAFHNFFRDAWTAYLAPGWKLPTADMPPRQIDVEKSGRKELVTDDERNKITSAYREGKRR